ncbi:FAD:protein FMN transferase [Noviherbaspirillum sp. UKPF54]|uniref:FAD:protein FMN transferase n=1 Tax=Noviherbaspirillum sp. UKPF54 TaxID=2601898 RepID=UPI0011B1BF55|nr:FAD:protein FMN transferase [Noviherbaspirillum sp. UKPF54]QDZ28015.1 FAD:protein FMN transferase [Noviherbaspirillum sp. UKPF54]
MRKAGSWLAAALLTLLLLGCGRNDAVYRTQGHVFGTQVEVSVYGESEQRAHELGTEVLKEFDRLHHKFHAWQPSQLTALNDAIARGETFQADEEMVTLLKSATELAEQSQNLFNPAIGHLIRLWGFQSSDITEHGPSQDEIRRWVDANPRMTDLVFDGTRISSRNKAVMLDLGGYAKGYALDRAARILRDAHVKAALVNVGGNIIAIGRPGDRPWRVGIRDPRSEGTVATIALANNEAVGTSGDYQRYFMKDGKRHPHIIDPRTGQTTDVVASVTIITSGGKDVGLRSDGNSKPLFVAGPARWKEMAQHLGLQEVMLIDAEHNVDMTPAMRERLAGASQPG